MLFIATNSYDVTTDHVLSAWPAGRPYFRLNVDLWSSYRVSWTAEGVALEDPLGRTLRDRDVTHFYWRKPYDPEQASLEPGSEANFLGVQRSYLLRELVNLMRARGVPMLVEPGAERRVGKLMQLREAKNWFDVPEWVVWQGTPPVGLEGEWLVKSLVMEPLAGGRFLFAVKPPSLEALDPGALWYSQREIEAVADLTICYVAGQCHAYRRSRPAGAPIDSRRSQSVEGWAKVHIPEVEERLALTMQALGLSFGRADFVVSRDERVWFLEVNPNGQFAWLDLAGQDGLTNDLVAVLSGERPLPAPMPARQVSGDGPPKRP